MFGSLVICTSVSASNNRSPSRSELDAVWRENMLTGTRTIMAFDNSRIDVASDPPAEPYTYAGGRPENAVWTNHGISVMRRGEGFWGNGGWVLKGGLLSYALAGTARLELYGKANVRIFPHFRFLHRDEPHETSYEFFLLHRPQSVERATIVREWTFPTDIVVTNDNAIRREDVRGAMTYDAENRQAIVRISGLKQPFEVRVGVSQLR